MAITAIERENIMELVALMFDAAPGGIFLPQLVQGYEAARNSIGGLADLLDGTPLFLSLYDGRYLEDTTQFLTPLQLQEDPGAIEWVTGYLDAGASWGTIMAAAWGYLDDLPDTAPGQYVKARDIMWAKAAVADYYSVDDPVMSTDYAELHALLVGVDDEWRDPGQAG